DRALYGLTPQLVLNRVVRNQAVLRPRLNLPQGWRLRARAEVGAMTRPGESNFRFNIEGGAARRIGRDSEIYSSYGHLHYAQASDAGYYAPNAVQTLEGGWSRDFERKAVKMSFDAAGGAGRSRDHGDIYGRWGGS